MGRQDLLVSFLEETGAKDTIDQQVVGARVFGYTFRDEGR